MTPRNALGLFADAPIKGTTPAEAGAQLGDGADGGCASLLRLGQLGPGLRRGGGERMNFITRCSPADAGEQGSKGWRS